MSTPQMQVETAARLFVSATDLLLPVRAASGEVFLKAMLEVLRLAFAEGVAIGVEEGVAIGRKQGLSMGVELGGKAALDRLAERLPGFIKEFAAVAREHASDGRKKASLNANEAKRAKEDERYALARAYWDRWEGPGGNLTRYASVDEFADDVIEKTSLFGKGKKLTRSGVRKRVTTWRNALKHAH